MRIEHIAIWVNNLEVMRSFYETYFMAVSGEKYFNPNKNFSSYFLSFTEGARLELMHTPIINTTSNSETIPTGFVHLAISVGTKEKVDALTEQLRTDAYTIAGEPRTTGDGYYESVILDPEGNRIEVTL
ncbi:VOC family protein [Maribacter sp. ACAM166]|uniref:VOC family protein n=1 Tax=Maribacter sp. ACAM166 TaxID=2508996 RepID=UPI0010FEAF58|nr:VOC family protein [Maribacter sp. ACAM166]TLP73034.1 glyoxalase/bleomycin resistance/extradiol dioxygenase family protein [Maribacter sp. ACAM166]